MQGTFMEQFDSAASYVSAPLRELLLTLPARSKADAREIRLRAGLPLALTMSDGPCYISPTGRLQRLPDGALRTTRADVEDTFYNLCGHSIHAHEREIARGYLMVAGGHRAGLCGRAVYGNGALQGLRDVSSINLRIAKQIRGPGSRLLPLLEQGGLLLCGPPGSGKTTVLRDVVRLLSDSGVPVALIDARGELAAVTGGAPGYDVGCNTDVLTGLDKADGVEIALRTLSPAYIAFDEFGTLEELRAVEQMLHAGARLLATIHAADSGSLLRRTAARRLLQSGAVHTAVFLGLPAGGPMELLDVSELFAQRGRGE